MPTLPLDTRFLQGSRVGAHAIVGRHTPGTFTNQLQTSFSKPWLLILTDPRTDHQPIKDAVLSSISTIAFCDTDSPLSPLLQHCNILQNALNGTSSRDAIELLRAGMGMG